MMNLPFLLDYLLNQTDWRAQRSSNPGLPGGIPGAVSRLVGATSTSDASAAYWDLDNNVVIQGQLFDAALPLVPVMLAAMAGSLSTAARTRVADLLVEISCGRPHASELELGNSELGRECRGAARAGVWLFYEMLNGADPGLRERALQLIYAVEEDRDRVFGILTFLGSSDPDRGVRDAATEFLTYMPGVIYDEA